MEYYADAFQKAAPTANRSFVLRKPGLLGNFTCRQCRRTGRGENGYEHAIKTAQQNGVAVVGISRMVTAAQSLILCSRQPAPDSLDFDVPVRSNGGAVWRRGNLLGTNPLAFAAPGEGDEILTFEWRLPYRHGEKCSTPARVICHPGYLGGR